jgi:hypothetical protein
MLASLPLDNDASPDAARVCLNIVKDYPASPPRTKVFNKICYIPCAADLSPPSGVDRIELQKIHICLDFRLPETAPSEDLFENLFEDQTPTADTDDVFQEAWGDSDQLKYSTVDHNSRAPPRATLVEIDPEQNLKVFTLLEASLRVLLHGSLNRDFHGIKIIEKPASLKELIPSQCDPRYVRV